MTPDQARALLDGTTPGPWDVGGAPDEHPAVVKHRTVDGGPLIACDNIAQEIHNEADAALIVAAPGMAAMIAGMREEYAIAYLDRDGNIDLMDDGYETLAAAQHRRDLLMAKVRPHTRIMRRHVGPWEEA